MSWLRSDKLDQFSAAFLKAQSQMKHAVKDSVNPHFKSKYADIVSDIDASRPFLVSNGISVLQPTRLVLNDGQAFLVVQTVLLHTSEQWVSAEYPVAITGLNPQQVKSGVTYARRTSYEAVLCLAAEDDDGNSASETVRQPSTRDVLDRMWNNSAASELPKNDPNYIIQIGKKFKGMRIGDVPLQQLLSFASWLKEESAKKGQPLTGQAKEFCDRVEACQGAGTDDVCAKCRRPFEQCACGT